jgi:hypothetical protein
VLLWTKFDLEDLCIAVHHAESSRGSENWIDLRYLSVLSCFDSAAQRLMRKTPVQNPAVLGVHHDAHILLSDDSIRSMGFHDKAAEC